MILVIGATGTVGTHLVHQLMQIGRPVRVLTRNREKAAKFGAKAEVAVGNLDDENSLAEAISGVIVLLHHGEYAGR